MPQTKFVLSKALKLGLKPIVVINKIDRQDAQPKEALKSIFDLFLALDANDDQLNFHYLYASGRNGWAVKELEDEHKNLDPLFQLIVDDVPAPKPQRLAGEEHPFKMLVTTLEADNFLGRILTGRIESGVITTNRNIKALNRDGDIIEKTRVTELLAFRGLARVPVSGPKPAISSPLPAWKRHRRRHAVRSVGGRRHPRPSHRSAHAGHDHFGQ